MTERRDQIIELMTREMIGPDPIDYEGCRQENGEEILTTDTPLQRYIAGVLFPRNVLDVDAEMKRTDETEPEAFEEQEEKEDTDQKEHNIEFLDDAEELINRSNAFQQSAMSLTVALVPDDSVMVLVNAGRYDRVEIKDDKTEKIHNRYYRRQISWNNDGEPVPLPSENNLLVQIPVGDSTLQFDVTLRMKKDHFAIYTFSLENREVNTPKTDLDLACYFQSGFSLTSARGFVPLPDSTKINVHDLDYLSNRMMYRDVHNYAIGHGCAADWEEKDQKVTVISSSVFPSYEVKPIMPTRMPGVMLKMYDFGPSGDFTGAVSELSEMCRLYKDWIDDLEKKKNTLASEFSETADRHIQNCRICLSRMENGINLLKTNQLIRVAFQYMNLAMLEQQLHYHLPLQKWMETEDERIILENPVPVMPDADHPDTWYEPKKNHYGQWRPFQIAFVLMNLQSMADRRCCERDIVDLIWFPTGGGKTEAYLGLSAYTIFIRRLMNKDDAGTAIIMRYTLRLLTTQQYQRAASMICACESIRQKHEDMFGKARISIGLWVGRDNTPNSVKKAISAFAKLKSGETKENPFVMLKCPWCGAQMGVFETSKGTNELLGYDRTKGKKGEWVFRFLCGNSENRCLFSSKASPLPLYIIDDIIYEQKPTLLLGTVDKFATLPFRPEAQGLFGFENGKKITSPDLIIQDELHLISGPLGSMVGHYETLISELCTMHLPERDIRPKIIASTATISRAREQCNALYACGKENVFQFPPSGLDAGNSFFAKEDKEKNGRRYVGIYASASPSDTTTAIRLYATLLYAGKQIHVDDEKQRDAYWTNVAYFNSLRELGQAATWIHADIDNYLDVIYKRHFIHKIYEDQYRKIRRYINRNEELTSRMPGDRVTASLASMEVTYPEPLGENGYPREYSIDICMATNMISVGLDVPRLGLMTVNGQPKTTSEYIQTTSRVGRDADNAPGLVFVLYRPLRPRDRSHYEHFHDYHSKLYCSVEPTSVTPFSSPVRERAIHALLVGMLRLKADKKYNEAAPYIPQDNIVLYARKIIEERVGKVELEELQDSMRSITRFLENWEDWHPRLWEGKKLPPDFEVYTEEVPLMYAAGTDRHNAWGKRGKETPMSMRNVDAECEAYVLPGRYRSKEDI